MGTVKFDTEAGDRRYSARYALDNANGIRLLLANYNALKSRQYLGDYDATIILIDLETAISSAGLTDRQRQALRLVFEEDLTQAEAGKRLGIAKDAVNHLLDRATDAISEVYYYWAQHGEGYSVTTTKGDAVNDEQISET